MTARYGWFCSQKGFSPARLAPEFVENPPAIFGDLGEALMNGNGPRACRVIVSPTDPGYPLGVRIPDSRITIMWSVVLDPAIQNSLLSKAQEAGLRDRLGDGVARRVFEGLLAAGGIPTDPVERSWVIARLSREPVRPGADDRPLRFIQCLVAQDVSVPLAVHLLAAMTTPGKRGHEKSLMARTQDIQKFLGKSMSKTPRMVLGGLRGEMGAMARGPQSRQEFLQTLDKVCTGQILISDRIVEELIRKVKRIMAKEAGKCSK